MEEVFFRLNELSPLINLLIEKIQALDSSLWTKQEKLACTKEMFEVVEDLRGFFAKISDFQNNEQNRSYLERAFSSFEWNTSVAATPLDFNKFSENGKLLLSSILKLLGMKGCGILIIDTYIKLCLKSVRKMKEETLNKNLITDKANIKLFLEGFSFTCNMLKKYWHISLSSNQKNTIMLCLHQISKILPNLLEMIKIQNSDMKNYCLNLLTKCLSKIEIEIQSDQSTKPNNQKFIMIMDFCLYKLNEITNYKSDFSSFIQKANDNAVVLKPIIDEILCSVMSISQVTNFEEDHSAILTSSQKVLKEYSDLTNSIQEENSSNIKLNANSLIDSLCSLEQKVNTAVLKLVLEVFSSGNLPLKNILNQCRMDISKDNKASEDLNVLISEFDSEMDKIMQIGFFAISCTSSLNRILKIQSCLASLESLESELIPSLTTLYITCTPKNKNNFKCLFDFWLNEITELKVLIDSVLDPAGFCGVVKSQIKSLGSIFKESFSSDSFINKLQSNLEQVIRYSRKLVKTLNTSMKDETEVNETTKEYLKTFQLALQECEAVVKLMGVEQDSNKIINQATKRYDYLMYTLEKLSSYLYSLLEDQSEKLEEHTNISNILIPQKKYYKLCETTDVTLVTRNTIPEILTPYVNNGLLRSKKRNVMYTTPPQMDECEKKFDKTFHLNYWEKTPVSSKRSRCCKPLTLNLELENSLDLEISTILDKISCLSNDFSKTFYSCSEVQNQESEKKSRYSKDAACGEENNMKRTYTSSGCCAKLPTEDNALNVKEEDSEQEKNLLGHKLRSRFFETLDSLSHADSLLVQNDSETNVDSLSRMNDLKIVEDRINFLKSQMPVGLP